MYGLTLHKVAADLDAVLGATIKETSGYVCYDELTWNYEISGVYGSFVLTVVYVQLKP